MTESEELQAAFQKGKHEGEIIGQLLALEKMQSIQGNRLDRADKRLTATERVQYALIGIIAWIQFLPKIEEIFK